ncbi:MAG TPA: chorismate mutase [Longimicrobiales bacterium]
MIEHDDVRSVRELDQLRAAIERIDRELIGLMAERVELARQTGETKRALGLPTLDPAREAEVVRRAATLARNARLDEDAVRSIFWHLIGLSRRAQSAEAS